MYTLTGVRIRNRHLPNADVVQNVTHEFAKCQGHDELQIVFPGNVFTFLVFSTVPKIC